MRSGRSTTRSVASSKSRAKSLKKMPLNAEITRFSAGRASRSAEYGVVIKDIGRLANTDTLSVPAASANQVPPHYQHSNTIQSEPRYVQHAPAPVPQQQQQQPVMMTSAPAVASGVLHDRPYTSTGAVDSRAVFVATDDPYYNTQGQVVQAIGGGGGAGQSMVPMQVVDMGQTYQVVGSGMQPQPVIIMQ